MDKQVLGYLDFKQLVLALGIVSSNRVTEKLKLLYILHLPPLLSKTDIESSKSNKSKGDAEVATEAEDFFCEDISFSIEALPSPTDDSFAHESNILNIQVRSSMNLTPNLSFDSNARSSIFYVDLPIDRMSQEGGESIDTISDISDLGRAANFDNMEGYSQFSDANINQMAGTVISDSSIDTRSLSSLRVFLDHPDSNFTQKSIPDMTQKNFMALWTSMLEIVGHCDIDMQHACKYCIYIS